MICVTVKLSAGASSPNKTINSFNTYSTALQDAYHGYEWLAWPWSWVNRCMAIGGGQFYAIQAEPVV